MKKKWKSENKNELKSKTNKKHKTQKETCKQTKYIYTVMMTMRTFGLHVRSECNVARGSTLLSLSPMQMHLERPKYADIVL